MLSLVIPTMIAGVVCSQQFVEASGWAYPPPPTTRTAETASESIDVNLASRETLQRLPGIGPKKADAILRARGRRPFRRPSDLLRVKGIGRKTLKRMAPMLRFESR